MLYRASIRSYDPYQHVQQRFSYLQYSKTVQSTGAFADDPAAPSSATHFQVFLLYAVFFL